jgi:hypothetical protein
MEGIFNSWSGIGSSLMYNDNGEDVRKDVLNIMCNNKEVRESMG